MTDIGRSLFVLRDTVEVADGQPPSDALYDAARQLWVTHAGKPFVAEPSAGVSAYGETTSTRTIEGADQSEASALASTFGETILTKTAEGVDTSEGNSLDPHCY